MAREITDDNYCLHELPKGQCADCEPPPNGVMKTGYRTRYGAVFHNDPNCDLMREPQRKYNRPQPAEPMPIHWAEAQARGLGQCLGCCTPQWQTRRSRIAALAKPSRVDIEATGVPGELNPMVRAP